MISEIILHALYFCSLREAKATAKLGFVVDRRTKYAVESSISTVALALSCVMAGSGDLDCLRLLRELRWKVDDITYGSHLAISMAIGREGCIVFFVQPSLFRF